MPRAGGRRSRDLGFAKHQQARLQPREPCPDQKGARLQCPAPQVTVSGNELTCRYEIPKLYQSVAVHFTSGMTRQSFEYFRDAYSRGRELFPNF